MSMNQPPVKDIVEAALLSAGEPLTIDRLLSLFTEEPAPAREDIRSALDELAAEWSERPLELRQVGSGYRFQVRQDFGAWIGRLEEERPPRYSRALMETLALIVYRQPITRAGIEEIRGVSVSSSIIKTLMEREWVRVVGHRDVPGKPALYGTTRKFLDAFNLKSLSELPELSDIKPVDHLQEELELSAEQTEAPRAANDNGSAPADEGAAQLRVDDDGGEEQAEEEAVEETAQAVSSHISRRSRSVGFQGNGRNSRGSSSLGVSVAGGRANVRHALWPRAAKVWSSALTDKLEACRRVRPPRRTSDWPPN